MVRMEFQMERMKSEMEQTVKSVDRKLNEMVGKERMKSEMERTATSVDTNFKVIYVNTDDPLSDQIVTPTVAFKARLNAHTAAPVSQVIVFPVVLFNEGDAYNSKTGKFTATTNRSYLFTIEFCVLQNKYLYVDIMVDGVAYTKTNIEDNDNLDCQTADTVAVLKAGQSVWVQPSASDSGNIIRHHSLHYWNTFSGVLLHK
ncbi:complement C1q tumor necrosis factor-related protein 2-like [Ruditapes philippinarum]|uniref:complement C1q tumor necrosis factor-related protein 2-like n=1 Tax=Ruditapes philippinarum TaxID=129788 RepID=UPI00295AFF4E|nr:complement C1q tumor necrosis factor-related protein 2-like [Ruditapes philippinarum]